MRICLATPLYPPEIAAPAPYIKELAKRLAGRHQVTVIAYARLPERVPGVEILAIDKRRPLPARLYAYTRALMRAARTADIIYAANGASVELPLLVAGLASKTPVIIGIADAKAHQESGTHFFRHVLERIAFAHARAIVEDMPLPRPEINPLLPSPAAELADYESSWEQHVAQLEGIFHHAE